MSYPNSQGSYNPSSGHYPQNNNYPTGSNPWTPQQSAADYSPSPAHTPTTTGSINSPPPLGQYPAHHHGRHPPAWNQGIVPLPSQVPSGYFPPGARGIGPPQHAHMASDRHSPHAAWNNGPLIKSGEGRLPPPTTHPQNNGGQGNPLFSLQMLVNQDMNRAAQVNSYRGTPPTSAAAETVDLSLTSTSEAPRQSSPIPLTKPSDHSTLPNGQHKDGKPQEISVIAQTPANLDVREGGTLTPPSTSTRSPKCIPKRSKKVDSILENLVESGAKKMAAEPAIPTPVIVLKAEPDSRPDTPEKVVSPSKKAVLTERGASSPSLAGRSERVGGTQGSVVPMERAVPSSAVLSERVAPGQNSAALSEKVAPAQSSAALSGKVAPGQSSAALSEKVAPAQSSAALSGKVAPAQSSAALSEKVAPAQSSAVLLERVAPVQNFVALSERVAPSRSSAALLERVVPAQISVALTDRVAPAPVIAAPPDKEPSIKANSTTILGTSSPTIAPPVNSTLEKPAADPVSPEKASSSLNSPLVTLTPPPAEKSSPEEMDENGKPRRKRKLDKPLRLSKSDGTTILVKEEPKRRRSSSEGSETCVAACDLAAPKPEPQPSFNEVESELEKMFAGMDEPAKSETPTKKGEKRGRPKGSKNEPKSSESLEASSSDVKKRSKRKRSLDATPSSKKKGKGVKLFSDGSDCNADLGLKKLGAALRDDSGSNASSGRIKGPMIRCQGPRESPFSFKVFNALSQAEEGDRVAKLQVPSGRRKNSTYHSDLDYRGRLGSNGSGMCSSTLSARYDAHTTDRTWLCVFCKNGPHSNTGLATTANGDLFGPYIIAKEPSEECLDSVADDRDINAEQKKGGRNKRSLRKADMVEHFRHKMSKKAKRTQSIEISSTPGLVPIATQSSGNEMCYEIWVHEDCALWAAGTRIVGSRIYGLQEAVWAAVTTVCTKCGNGGANIGCIARNCAWRLHHHCAQLLDWDLDEGTYIARCQQHRIT